MSTPYRSIPKMLAEREGFIGNSMSGQRVVRPHSVKFGDDENFTVEPGDYVVRSYSTVIAVRKSGTMFITSEKWGVTTERHKNLVRAWL